MMDPTYRYQQSTEQDYMLLQWLERMRADGDLSHTLSQGVSTPQRFLTFFQSRALFFRINVQGQLTYACWMEPCMGAAFVSYYTSPDVRGRPAKFYFFYDMIDLAFNNSVYPAEAIAGMLQERIDHETTKKFIELHIRLGYKYTGKLPKFFDGRDCYFVAMTAEDWEANDSSLKRRWIKSRESQGEADQWAEPQNLSLVEANGVTI